MLIHQVRLSCCGGAGFERLAAAAYLPKWFARACELLSVGDPSTKPALRGGLNQYHGDGADNPRDLISSSETATALAARGLSPEQLGGCGKS